MGNLTKKQNEVFQFIKKHLDDCGYAPSYREIGEHFKLSSSATVHGHIQSLVDKGMVRIGEEGEARSIELVPQPEPIHRGFRLSADVVNLPMMGLIAAGQPIEAIMDNETMAVPASFVLDGANSYVLKIKGQSMIEDGILDGDFVVIERNPSPKNGEVVVALLDNAYATLKRFYREKSRIRLQPANKTMDPIYVQDCIIQGVVRAVIRKFQPV